MAPRILCTRRGLLQAFSNNGSRDIVTPKTMCNHHIIARNEKNRSKLVILQSFNALCYIFRKWEHFQITKLNRVYMAEGQALPSSNIFPYKWDLNCHQILYFSATDLKLVSSTYFFLLFPFLVFTKSHVLNVRVGRSRDPLLQKAYSKCKIEVTV